MKLYARDLMALTDIPYSRYISLLRSGLVLTNRRPRHKYLVYTEEDMLKNMCIVFLIKLGFRNKAAYEMVEGMDVSKKELYTHLSDYATLSLNIEQFKITLKEYINESTS